MALLFTPVLFISLYVASLKYFRKAIPGEKQISIDIQDTPLPIWMHLLIATPAFLISTTYALLVM